MTYRDQDIEYTVGWGKKRKKSVAMLCQFAKTARKLPKIYPA